MACRLLPWLTAYLILLHSKLQRATTASWTSSWRRWGATRRPGAARCSCTSGCCRRVMHHACIQYTAACRASLQAVVLQIAACLLRPAGCLLCACQPSCCALEHASSSLRLELQIGYRPDDRLCTTLIRVCSQHGQAATALAIYDWMRVSCGTGRQGNTGESVHVHMVCSPAAAAPCAELAVCTKCERLTRVCLLAAPQPPQAPPSEGGAGLTPTVFTFTAAMRAALTGSLMDRALQVAGAQLEWFVMSYGVLLALEVAAGHRQRCTSCCVLSARQRPPSLKRHV